MPLWTLGQTFIDDCFVVWSSRKLCSWSLKTRELMDRAKGFTNADNPVTFATFNKTLEVYLVGKRNGHI